jgi:hypothetical protein
MSRPEMQKLFGGDFRKNVVNNSTEYWIKTLPNGIQTAYRVLRDGTIEREDGLGGWEVMIVG